TLYEDQAAISVSLDNFQILLRALTVTHVTSHLFVLENLARILALASRTVCTVGDGHAVRCTHTTEAPTLHSTRKALALRVTSDVDLLAGKEVVSADGGTNRQKCIFAFQTEFSDTHLKSNFSLSEVLALRLSNVLLLGLAR